MGKIFGNKVKKEEVVMASAPEEPETREEIKVIDEYSNGDSDEINKEMEQMTEKNHVQELEQPVNYVEVPRCMSQASVNNLVIDNNIMLKHIISKLEEN